MKRFVLAVFFVTTGVSMVSWVGATYYYPEQQGPRAKPGNTLPAEGLPAARTSEKKLDRRR